MLARLLSAAGASVGGVRSPCHRRRDQGGCQSRGHCGRSGDQGHSTQHGSLGTSWYAVPDGEQALGPPQLEEQVVREQVLAQAPVPEQGLAPGGMELTAVQDSQ